MAELVSHTHKQTFIQNPMGQLVSTIAIFVLKRDVKVQLTN